MNSMIMKQSSKKKKSPSSPTPNLLHRTLEDYRGRDKDLLTEYKNSGVILDRLCNVSTSITTTELIGELFFEFLMHEIKDDLPEDQRLRLIRHTRYEVMRLYELARAAKMLRDKKNLRGWD
jgi:hypothetical protein